MAFPRPLRLVSRILILALLLVLAMGSTAGAFETRIIGGTTASIQDHPHQVLVLTAMSGQQFQCGGSIRDATHVVTAAHCVVDEGGFYPKIVAPSAVQVGYSSADQQNLAGPLAVQRVSVAPAYLRDGTSASDAAVLTLATPIDLPGDPEAEAISFASDAELLGAGTAFATGWGATSEGGNAVRFLQGVELPLRPGAACGSVFGQEYDGSVMLCAGGTGNAPSGNKDTCQGDSGGPLAIDTDPAANVTVWELVGITSFGSGCGRRDMPAVYAWVQSTILRPFLEAVNPAAPPTLPATDPSITGTPRVGSTVGCAAPVVPGATPTRYIFVVVDGSNFTIVKASDSPTFTLPASVQGAFLVCDVRYETPGGFGYLESSGANRVGPVLAVAPPPGGGATTPGGGATTPPPPPVVPADTTRPRARVATVRCLRDRCKIKVNAGDVGGLVRSLSAKLSYRVRRCRTVEGRRSCRSVTKTKRLRPKRSSGGFTITVRLKPARYTLTAVATDTSGNRSAPARKSFRVKRSS